MAEVVALEMQARDDNEDQGHNYNGDILESWLICPDWGFWLLGGQ